MIVVDASAVVELLATEKRNQRLERRLLEEPDLHAPHLLDVEVANALRGMTSRGELGGDRAADALLDVGDMPVELYPHSALLPRAWELRRSLTIYDAVYVALAEALEAPLVTCDAGLARAAASHVQIELYPRRT